MKVDFYNLLEVKEDASEKEIVKAYRRLAKTWHPDKNPENRKLAETKFKDISEAYQVLQDPDKRAAYDREKLAETEAPARSGGNGENEEMFSESRRSRGARFGERLFRKIFGDDLEFASYRRAEPVERLLLCSLEELFNGTTKKIKISRNIVDASGKKLPVEEIQTIEIKPGSKKGERFVFPEMGDEELNVIPADLIFIVGEKPHAVFQREENDLIVTRKISLVEALTGVTFYQKTLDGRQLKVAVEDVIGPGYEKIVAGEGMPAVVKGSFRRGNLRIRFVTEFPAKLTAEQKFAVRRLFAG